MDVSSDHASISQVQWDEFVVQYRTVLNLLRQIAGVWNLEDPCVISGFDMDRVGTVTVGLGWLHDGLQPTCQATYACWK